MVTKGAQMPLDDQSSSIEFELIRCSLPWLSSQQQKGCRDLAVAESQLSFSSTLFSQTMKCCRTCLLLISRYIISLSDLDLIKRERFRGDLFVTGQSPKAIHVQVKLSSGRKRMHAFAASHNGWTSIENTSLLELINEGNVELSTVKIQKRNTTFIPSNLQLAHTVLK